MNYDVKVRRLCAEFRYIINNVWYQYRTSYYLADSKKTLPPNAFNETRYLGTVTTYI